MNLIDDEDDEGGRNYGRPEGTKKAKERLKSQAEAASLRDQIDNMVKSNELLTAKQIEAKKELSDKRAQEKKE